MNFKNIQSEMTDEEKLLIKRAEDMLSSAANGSISFSRFLTPREAYILGCYGLITSPPRASLTSQDSIGFLWGGYPSAERRVFCAIPSYLAYSLPEVENDSLPASDEELSALCSEELSFEFSPLFIRTSGYVNLTHRDFLGALVGLGIDRSVLGDILLVSGGAIVFASSRVADFIKTELHEVGRDKVRVTDASPESALSTKREFEQVGGTVASARLDAVVSELTHASRETAKELIRRGLVEHNFFTAVDCDAEIRSGDIISVKRDGKIRNGKYAVDSIDDLTAKGRLRLFARRYM